MTEHKLQTEVDIPGYLEMLEGKIRTLNASIEWLQQTNNSLHKTLGRKEALIFRQKQALAVAHLKVMEANKRAYQSVSQRFIRQTTQKVRDLGRQLRIEKQKNTELEYQIAESHE